jgi:hypothetical protein
MPPSVLAYSLVILWWLLHLTCALNLVKSTLIDVFEHSFFCTLLYYFIVTSVFSLHFKIRGFFWVDSTSSKQNIGGCA